MSIDESSFGIIPLKKGDDGKWHVLLIKQRNGSFWGFPKGHGDGDESPQKSAERELFEETGYRAVHYLFEEPFVEHYSFIKNGIPINKIVSYFAAAVEGQLSIQTEEILDAAWTDLDGAADLLTYPQAKALCKRLSSLLPQLDT